MSTHTSFRGDEPASQRDVEALLSRAQSGDHAAFNELFDRYRERIIRSARVRIGPKLANKVDPEDIAQETLRVAWEHLRSFDARNAPRLIDWLANIARNCIRDEVKRWSSEKRDVDLEVSMRSPRQGDAASTWLPIAGGSGTPSQIVSAEQQKEIYDECLSELREHYQDVILLKQYADMSWDEIAQRIGSPNAKAAVQLHSRAMAALEALLKANGFDLIPPPRPS